MGKIFGSRKHNENHPVSSVDKSRSVIETEKISEFLTEIIAELEEIRFDKFPFSDVDDYKKESSEKILNDIKIKINDFTVSLRSTNKLVKYFSHKTSVFKIGNELLFFVHNLNWAIKNGDIQTAMFCTDSLGYGIEHIYNSVPNSDKSTIESEIDMRCLKKIQKRREIVLLSRKLADSKEALKFLQIEFDNKKFVFDKAQEMYDQNRRRYPQRYQGLKYLVDTQKQNLTPEELKAYQEANYIINTSNELKKIKKEIVAANISIKECEYQIEEKIQEIMML